MRALNKSEMQYQQRLAAANEFTLEDVEANREGRLTENQKAKFRRRRPALGCLGLFFLLTGIMILLLAASFAFGKDEPATRDVRPLLVVIFSAVGLASLSVPAYVAWTWYKETKDSRVLRYEGHVLRDEESKVEIGGGLNEMAGQAVLKLLLSGAGKERDYFYVGGDGTKWGVSREAFDALDESCSHRVYYSPYSSKLLSVEVLPDDAPKKHVPRFSQFS